MASNSFGTLFKVTTWGESHGKAIGAVIDGCPAGLKLDVACIQEELMYRAPGQTSWTSARKEPDQVDILSGLFEGKTTGAPLSLIIWNRDAQSQHYESIKHLLRPGHANYTYLQKYGCFDFRGGGRSSARETACRVAAGAVAKRLLAEVGIEVVACLQAVGSVQMPLRLSDVEGVVHLKRLVRESALFCPIQQTEEAMQRALIQAVEERDSLGGVVEAVAFNVPAGWGDPVYEKLEANLAKAMLSIPASKGFEIGQGFAAADLKGSQHNDLFAVENEKAQLISNQAGGALGGISTGMPIVIRVPFKPTSSIGKEQATATVHGQASSLQLPEGSRHDPCLAIRAVPVVEAMFALVLVDAFLMSRLARLDHFIDNKSQID